MLQNSTFVSLCVCVCVHERMREREKENGRQKTRRPCLRRLVSNRHVSEQIRAVVSGDRKIYMCILSRLIVACLAGFADPTSGGLFFGP